MNRRGFLGAILALGAAPAIAKIENLMPMVSRRPSSIQLLYSSDDGINWECSHMHPDLLEEKYLEAVEDIMRVEDRAWHDLTWTKEGRFFVMSQAVIIR